MGIRAISLHVTGSITLTLASNEFNTNTGGVAAWVAPPTKAQQHPKTAHARAIKTNFTTRLSKELESVALRAPSILQGIRNILDITRIASLPRISLEGGGTVVTRIQSGRMREVRAGGQTVCRTTHRACQGRALLHIERVSKLKSSAESHIHSPGCNSGGNFNAPIWDRWRASTRFPTAASMRLTW